MKKKIAALLAALSVFTGVCMPVSADDIAETGSAQVICIQTVEDTDEPDGSDTAEADEAADNADEPAEAEDTADSEQDNDTDPCEDQAQPDDITDSDVISDTDTESENADADVNEEDSENNATSYICEDDGKTEDDICDADYSDLINDEIEFLYPGWCSWDSVSGTLTLKGQLPYTYYKDENEQAYSLAVIAGIDALNIRKIIITSGTKATTSCSQMFRNMKNLEAIEGLQNLDTSRVETMTGMFIDCDNLKYIDLSGLDTSNVKKMNGMFNSCDSLRVVDMSGCDTSTVRNMRVMFKNCKSLKTIVVDSKWTTAAVENSDNMFLSCESLKGGAGTEYNENHIKAEYARIDKGSAPGYFSSSSFPRPYISIRPVFGGRTVSFECDNGAADIYYCFGSSNITKSSMHAMTGETIFLDEELSGKDAALYFKAYKNGKWSEVGKWGVLNVKLDKPLLVQSGPESKRTFKLYTQSKNSYIVYTTDGTTPRIEEGTNKLTVKNGTLIWGTSGVITVPKGKTVKAIAIRCGLVTSNVMVE